MTFILKKDHLKGLRIWRSFGVDMKLISRLFLKIIMIDLREMNMPLDANQFPFIRQIARNHIVRKSLDGYAIYVYAPELLVIEKLRAICQQMPGYEIFVPSIKPSARARDFFDIYTVMQYVSINLIDQSNRDLIKEVFGAKRVPLYYLKRIGDFREFHRSDFISVEATVKSKDSLENYDFYFNFVLSIVSGL
jgi:hypothetical protein